MDCNDYRYTELQPVSSQLLSDEVQDDLEILVKNLLKK